MKLLNVFYILSTCIIFCGCTTSTINSELDASENTEQTISFDESELLKYSYMLTCLDNPRKARTFEQHKDELIPYQKKY